jgi:hypothetical protein
MMEPACTYSRNPCSLVLKLEIVIDGNAVEIPRIAIATLSDLGSAEMQKSKNFFVLILRGGDASESYVVKLILSTTRIIKKVFFSGLDPDNPAEIATYPIQKIQSE